MAEEATLSRGEIYIKQVLAKLREPLSSDEDDEPTRLGQGFIANLSDN